MSHDTGTRRDHAHEQTLRSDRVTVPMNHLLGSQERLILPDSPAWHARIATDRGSTRKPNEDFTRAGNNVVVLLDGAGVPNGAVDAARAQGAGDPLCRDGVLWYVNNLGPRLHELASDRGRTLQEALHESIADVTAMHPRCPRRAINAPSATVVVARENGDELEYLVLADSSLVLDNGDEAERITDSRNDDLDAVLRAELDRLPRGSAEHAEEFGKYWLEHCKWRNVKGGYWVASDDPDAVENLEEGAIGSVGLDEIQGLALLSDGAARAVDMFGGTFRDLMDTCRDKSPMAVINEVRAKERAAGAGQPKGSKLHDDASIAYVRLDGSPQGIWVPR